MLYEAGADLNTADNHGAYPIHYAAQMCGSNSDMGIDSRIGLTGKIFLRDHLGSLHLEWSNVVVITYY